MFTISLSRLLSFTTPLLLPVAGSRAGEEKGRLALELAQSVWSGGKIVNSDLYKHFILDHD